MLHDDLIHDWVALDILHKNSYLSFYSRLYLNACPSTREWPCNLVHFIFFHPIARAGRIKCSVSRDFVITGLLSSVNPTWVLDPSPYRSWQSTSVAVIRTCRWGGWPILPLLKPPPPLSPYPVDFRSIREEINPLLLSPRLPLLISLPPYSLPYLHLCPPLLYFLIRR